MKLREVKFNISALKEEMNLCKTDNNFVIIVSSGKIKIIYLPEYGETKIVTHQGEVKRIKSEEGEEF